MPGSLKKSSSSVVKSAAGRSLASGLSRSAGRQYLDFPQHQRAADLVRKLRRFTCQHFGHLPADHAQAEQPYANAFFLHRATSAPL
jgi:hypothetical protein